MNKLSILPLLLFASCSLLFEPSKDVVQAQQTAYIGMTKLEQNYSLLLEEYEVKLKALVTYVYTFTYELKMEEAETAHERDAIQRELEIKLDDEYSKIDSNLQRWIDIGASGHGSVKKLIEAVYEYITTTSVNIGDIADLVDSSIRTWGEVRDN